MANQMDLRIEWHSPDRMFAAAFLRDGEPWYLEGALVGMGWTRDAAVHDLVGIAGHLVKYGENFLTEGPIAPADRQWLFDLLDRGNDVEEIQARYEAIRQAVYEAIRQAGGES